MPHEGTSVPDLLKLIGSGANGQILMALGPRSLRTKKLTERVPTYAPRTVYRHTRALSELGLIDREEIAGVPSTVIHSLSASGRALCRIMISYAELSLPWAAGPSGGDGLWPFCALLGDMWASGWIEELSHGGRSATELTEATAAMTFHQVSRRTQQMVSWGLLYESVARGGRKRYQLSDQARHGMAMVTALGRWRQGHATGGESGLGVGEMATVLRTSFVLLSLPARQSLSIKLGIVGTLELEANASEALTGHVSATGVVRSVKDRIEEDAWALGTVDTWFAAILDGIRGKMRVGGDLEFADDFLKQLNEVLSSGRATAGAR